MGHDAGAPRSALRRALKFAGGLVLGEVADYRAVAQYARTVGVRLSRFSSASWGSEGISRPCCAWPESPATPRS